MIDDPCAIEMKTISTNMSSSAYKFFKLLKDTRCARLTSKQQMTYTSIMLHEGSLYYGIIVLHNNKVYIDISECYKKHHSSNVANVYIPVVFDMTGKYAINLIENKN